MQTGVYINLMKIFLEDKNEESYKKVVALP